MDLVEQLGSGIPRILESYDKDCFKFSENFLRVVLPSSKVTDEKSRLVDGLVDGLVESQQMILKLVAKNPKISKREMAEIIGISTTAIDKNIEKLKDAKLIKRVGSSRSGYWSIMK